MEAATGRPRVSRSEWAGLAAVVALALAVRAWRWHQTAVMFNDGPRFLAQAQAAATGDWGAVLAESYHPLYALATAGLHALLGGAAGPAAWERAAAAVSVLSGGVAVAAFWVFLRRAFDPPTALGGALLLAVHDFAVAFAADVQSDGLYLACFAVALALAAVALEDRRIGAAALCGAASGFAYLTRPEGLGIGLAAGVAGAAAWWRGALPTRRALVWAGALGLGLALVATPYVAALHGVAGEWILTQKKSFSGPSGVEGEAAPRPAPGARVNPVAVDVDVPSPREEEPVGPVRALADLVSTSVSALRLQFLALALVGAWLRRGRPALAGQLTLAVLGVYAAVLVWFVLEYGYVSRRHVLPPLILLLGYAAWAAAPAVRAAARALGRPPPTRVRALALGVGVLALVSGVRHLGHHREDVLAERRAAEWVERAGGAPGAPVAAGRRRVAYYAGAPWYPLRDVPEAAPLLPSLRLAGVRYLIVDDATRDIHPDLPEPAALEAAGVKVAHREEAHGHRAWVFDLGDGSPGEGAGKGD